MIRAPRGLLATLLIAAALACACASHAFADAKIGDSAQQRFREATALARGGDYPRAIAGFDSLARAGVRSAPLYWNWAQASAARGSMGEALWALLVARELDPGDPAIGREIDRLREAANLDRAEIAPDPLATVARFARRFRLDLVAALLLVISLGLHVAFRRARAPRLAAAAWVSVVLGLVIAVAPVAGAFARPLGAVVRREAPLLDAASPTAEAIGNLREGEVVPILEASGGYVRVEDSSGARGWALASDVRALR